MSQETIPAADHRRTAPHRMRYLVIAFIAAALAFTHPIVTLVVGALALLLYEVFYRRNRPVIALVVSGLLSFTAFEYFGRFILKAQMSQFFTGDADHRLLPNKELGINSDGIRCPVEAVDFTDETFNIILLGDSFIYGSLLDYEDSLPAQIERMLRDEHPSLNARCLNFGWISSSPGPARRLLRDIGHKYKPDLVVLSLDVTDFHDDIWVLGKVGYWDRSPTAYLFTRLGLGGVITELYESFRLNILWRTRANRARPIPARRFFVVEQPLGDSLPDMVETEQNLRLIAEYCEEELGVPFVLFMHPRAFQYNSRESPDNFERFSYTIKGPYSREPYKWLEALKGKVRFPVHSLLEDFEQAEKFPLYFSHDPHWNADGVAVAARGIIEALQADDLLPAPDDKSPS